MKEYNYKEKIIKVNNKKYNAIIPDKHSNIEAYDKYLKEMNKK